MPTTVKGRTKIKQKTEEEFFSSGSDSAASAPASVLTFPFRKIRTLQSGW
jgi:hypothetical protein